MSQTWIRENLPTETFRGEENVVFEHPVGESCPVCGHDHGGTEIVERVPVADLAEAYNDDLPPGNPVKTAKNDPDSFGQERFFEQPGHPDKGVSE